MLWENTGFVNYQSVLLISKIFFSLQNSTKISFATNDMGWRRDELLFQREITSGELSGNRNQLVPSRD